MKSLLPYIVGLIFLQGAIAVFASHGLNGSIFKEERDIGSAMKRLNQESPRAAIVVKVCYSLILLEFGAVLLLHFIGNL